MDVLTPLEGVDQYGVFRHVGHDPQLYLGVVSRNDEVSRLCYERLSYPLSEFRPYRYVLQIRFTGGEPPCSRHGLVKGSMYPSCIRVYHGWEGVYICGLQLGKGPVCKYLGRKLMK